MYTATSVRLSEGSIGRPAAGFPLPPGAQELISNNYQIRPSSP